MSRRPQHFTSTPGRPRRARGKEEEERRRSRGQQPPSALHPRSHLAPVTSSRRQQPRLRPARPGRDGVVAAGRAACGQRVPPPGPGDLSPVPSSAAGTGFRSMVHFCFCSPTVPSHPEPRPVAPTARRTGWLRVCLQLGTVTTGPWVVFGTGRGTGVSGSDQLGRQSRGGTGAVGASPKLPSLCQRGQVPCPGPRARLSPSRARLLGLGQWRAAGQGAPVPAHPLPAPSTLEALLQASQGTGQLTLHR